MNPLIMFAMCAALGYFWDWAFRREVHHGENMAMGAIGAAAAYMGLLWN